jgi:thioredoxin-like negative regulator of GroEL
MNNCGYCDKFTPEWDKFVAGYSGPVVLQKKERQEAGDELNKYNVEGFPTVILCDENGEYKEFNGDRTSDGLNQFIAN